METEQVTKTVSGADAKWAAIVEDQLIPLPRRRLKASDILFQSAADSESSLVRDYDSPNDIGLDADAMVDLAEGNVFRLSQGCEQRAQVQHDALAKFAFIVDDRWKVTIQPRQLGETLRSLLAVPDDVDLLRDFESPQDEIIEDNERIKFADGPVFITRSTEAKDITIFVNGRKKTVKKKKLSFNELVALAFNPVPTGPNIMFTITYQDGPHANPEGSLPEGGTVKIKEGMIFNVTPTDKS